MPETRPRRTPAPGAAAREGLLRRYGLLDARPDEEMDGLVGLAARSCGLPRTCLGVVYGERLLLRARSGVDVTDVALPSPLLERVLGAPGALVVSNVVADPRLSEDPIARALAAGAVLGVRVATAAGLVVGVLLAADDEPRPFDSAALDSLGTVARQLGAILELRRLRARVGSSPVRRPSTGDFLKLSESILEAGRHTVIEAGFSVDGRGAIASFGPDAEAIFGIEGGAALGTPLLGLLAPARPGDADGVQRALARPLEAAGGPFGVRGRRADGSEFPAELTLSPIPRGSRPRLTSVHLRDVSGRRLLERALAASVVSRLDRGALLTSSPYPAEVCEAAVRTLWIMPEVDHCALFLLDASRDALDLAFWCGDPPRDTRSRVPLDDRSLLARVARSGDRALGRRSSAGPDGSVGRIEAALPLLAAGEVVGVLKLESASPVAFSPALMALCGSVASGIAAAFEGTNITELLLRAKVALERAFDAMPELVAILDGAGRIRRLNQAVADRLGRPVRELVGEDFKALFPFTRDWLAEGAGRAGERPVWSELQDAERGVIWEVSLLELDSPSPLLGDRVVFLRDVTRDREMARRMLAVEKRAAMGDLLTGVAHEVRNPLAAIQAAIDGLEREPETTLAPDDRALLGIIHRQVARLGSLMNNLLYIGKPLQNVAPEGHSLVKVCRGAVELWKESPLADSRPVELAVHGGEDPLPARCDSARIEQVVLNLLDNAAQHSEPAAPIRVELDRDGGDVLLRVVDAGHGLPAAAAARLFEPFFTTRDNGTGLGLALVKGIVEGHGGSVGARNNDPPPGATFEVRLPAPEGEA